ncbi:MAG: flagellar biosynthetic protein FliO [Burkholderiaceae bacterium]
MPRSVACRVLRESRGPALAAIAALILPAIARAQTGAEAPSLAPMLVALGFVLALIPVSMWLLKRFGSAQPAAGAGLRVVAQLALGPRERIVIVEAGERWLLLGVTAASITRVGTLPKGDASALATTPSSFASLLARLQK